MVADVHVPLLDIAGDLGDDRGFLEGLDITGLLNGPVERGVRRADHGNFGDFLRLDGSAAKASCIPRLRSSRTAPASKQRSNDQAMRSITAFDLLGADIMVLDP